MVKRCGITHEVNSRAQASMEYILIISLSLAILIPTSILFYNYSQASNEGVIRSQINKIGNTMQINGEQIYGLADGSMVTIEMNIPKNVNQIYILQKRELIIEYDLSSGTSEAVFFLNTDMSTYYYMNGTLCTNETNFPLQNSTLGTIEPGLHKIKFESKINHVLVSIVS